MATYTLVKDIARGGFGRVVMVTDEHGTTFAMKLLEPSPQMAQVPIDQLRKRFEREVKYQQTISHPNVVRIHDVNMAANPPYCVMELAEGTLDSDIAADHTLGGDPKPALFDILNGLEFLAEKGFIHRDLKPANVLKFRNPDGSFRYAISDFGLMRPGNSDTTTLTATGDRGGTPDYAAPELMQDFSRATTAADIYAFGAILHDIFVAQARIPFTQLTASGAIGPIIERCTKTNPARRYKTIAEVREDLFEVLNAGPLVFASSDEKRAVELLGEHRDLSSDEWDQVCYALESNDVKGIRNDNIFRALRSEHITQLHGDSPDLVKSTGMRFCEFSMSRLFDFDYCDILSARLETFFDHGDTELRAQCLLAFLDLGVTHNRWLVERNFYRRALEDCDANVMQRFIVEAGVRDYPLKLRVDHLLGSIVANPELLHPALKAAIA